MLYAVPTKEMQKMYKAMFTDARVLLRPTPIILNNKVIWCSLGEINGN